jgi:hypothetical protein
VWETHEVLFTSFTPLMMTMPERATATATARYMNHQTHPPPTHSLPPPPDPSLTTTSTDNLQHMRTSGIRPLVNCLLHRTPPLHPHCTYRSSHVDRPINGTSTAHCPHPNSPSHPGAEMKVINSIHICFQLQTSPFTVYSHRRGKMLPPHLPPQRRQAQQWPHLSVMCPTFEVHRRLFVVRLRSLQPSVRMLPPRCRSRLHV